MGQPGRYPVNLAARLRTWSQDRLLRRVARNSSYLLTGTVLGAGLSLIQGLLAARMLGAGGLGVLGAVTLFASTINRLFSFRMGEVVVRHLSLYLEEGQRERAGALVKAAFLGESATAVLAYLLVVVLAPWAAVTFADDPGTAGLFRFYGLALLVNLVTETSTGVLQVGNRFRGQAALTLLQSIITIGVIGWAYLTQRGLGETVLLGEVVLAYWLGKTAFGLGIAGLALWRLRELLGPGWYRARLSALPNPRGLARFALSTNLSGTVNLVVRDSEVLWVAYFLANADQGLYKQALALISMIALPINTLIGSTSAEISRLAAAGSFPELRRLLRRVTVISTGWTAATGLGLVLLGRWVLSWYGHEFPAAYPTLLILLAGFGLANILFWNRPLVLAFGQTGFPLRVTLLGAVVKVALTVLLVPRLGIAGEAISLSAYFLITIAAIALRGRLEMKRAEENLRL